MTTCNENERVDLHNAQRWVWTRIARSEGRARAIRVCYCKNCAFDLQRWMLNLPRPGDDEVIPALVHREPLVISDFLGVRFTPMQRD